MGQVLHGSDQGQSPSLTNHSGRVPAHPNRTLGAVGPPPVFILYLREMPGFGTVPCKPRSRLRRPAKHLHLSRRRIRWIGR